jgi:hypothetical protein
VALRLVRKDYLFRALGPLGPKGPEAPGGEAPHPKGGQ